MLCTKPWWTCSFSGSLDIVTSTLIYLFLGSACRGGTKERCRSICASDTIGKIIEGASQIQIFSGHSSRARISDFPPFLHAYLIPKINLITTCRSVASVNMVRLWQSRHRWRASTPLTLHSIWTSSINLEIFDKWSLVWRVRVLMETPVVNLRLNLLPSRQS